MVKAVLLYGSKARRDHDRLSDTDLLGICSYGEIEKPFDQNGVSFHIYPQDWLNEQAASGSLFLLHIVTEAVAIFDPTDALSDLKSRFSYRASYHQDNEIGSRVVAAVIGLDEPEFSPIMRKRYFWGLRTTLMADAAERRLPIFSADALERASGVSGLAPHIKARADASFSECQHFGGLILERVGNFVAKSNEEKEKNLRFLFDFGGVGTATAAEIIYSFRPGLIT